MKKIIIIILMISNISLAAKCIYSTTQSGDVIFSYNELEVRPIASLTKVMNVLVALDAVDKNIVSLDDIVTIDDEIMMIKETSIKFKKGDKIKLEELLKAQLVYSANNAAYATAKYVYGDIDKFVEKMNMKAEELGMKNTKFYTPAGLPTNYTDKPNDVSNAYDLNKMALAALKDKRILEYAKLPFVKINGIKYFNRNKLLNYNGNFGLKTGFHNMAEYNMITFNKIYNVNLINVSLGDETLNDRDETHKKLSDLFKDSFKVLIRKGQVYGNIEVKNSNEGMVEVVVEKDFLYYNYNIDIEEEIFPLDGNVKKGEIVGKIKIYSNSKLIDTINLIANTSATKMNVIKKIFSKIV